MKENKWFKTCPQCSNKIYYSTQSNLIRALRINCVCNACKLKNNTFGKGLKHTDETKEKIRIARLGKKHTKITILKISNAKKGKPSTNPFTEETREKMRIARWKQIENIGGGPTYNPKACKFIDELNKKLGFELQHALNGGEIMITGYSLDGYDKKRNIVFEYDEPSHHTPSKKKNDIVRQKRIIRKIRPSHFLRYDEKTNNIYEVL
jgi:hypothetical protein